MVGQIVGNYRVLSELSRGGMGAVYRAQHEVLGRLAAIKFLRPELSASEAAVERFFDEARAASAIKHPGIIEVYDFGYTAEGDAYYVMELLDGETLAARLARTGKLGELEAIAIARDIASALTAAHDAGIIHRDLKPDNIFLVRSIGGERVKVVDFGVAKLADRASQVGHTQTGVLMGTPLYMAPEQALQAAKIDHRADLYSLGCILYELLVGAPPFSAEGAGEIIAMQIFTPAEPPRTGVPTLSPEIDALVVRLLAKAPSDRPANAGEVQRSLFGIASRLPVERRIAPTPLPSGTKLELGIMETPPPRSESSGTLGLVAGLATVLVAGVVALIVMLRSDDDAATPTPPATPRATPAMPAATPKAIPQPADPTPTAPDASVPSTTRKPSRLPPRPRGTQQESGPVVRPGGQAEGTLTSPSAFPPRQGPVTSQGSPIETTLE
ncbi:MAG: protein kinase [Kofleriaceae bacterium]|nr:protein kinase [Kofleriaceae bacterium]